MLTSTICHTVRKQKPSTSYSRLLSYYWNVKRLTIKLKIKKNTTLEYLWKQVLKWEIKDENKN